jgi:hypothetical protein
MSTIERKGFAFLSACGITATIFTYIVSFSGVTSEATSHWEIVLIVGAFVVLIPMAVVERTRLSGRTFSFKEFGRGRPGWMMLCIKLFWVIAVAHVIWFYLRYSGGVPTVEHGQFVLDNHGRIEELTKSEYLSAEAGELRLCASWIVNCYLMAAAYWWFPRSEQQND